MAHTLDVQRNVNLDLHKGSLGTVQRAKFRRMMDVMRPARQSLHRIYMTVNIIIIIIRRDEKRCKKHGQTVFIHTRSLCDKS